MICLINNSSSMIINFSNLNNCHGTDRKAIDQLIDCQLPHRDTKNTEPSQAGRQVDYSLPPTCQPTADPRHYRLPDQRPDPLSLSTFLRFRRRYLRTVNKPLQVPPGPE